MVMAIAATAIIVLALTAATFAAELRRLNRRIEQLERVGTVLRALPHRVEQLEHDTPDGRGRILLASSSLERLAGSENAGQVAQSVRRAMRRGADS